MNALQSKPASTLWRLSTLFALSAVTACQPEPELEEIPLRMERTADTLTVSWDGARLHRFEVVRCDEPSRLTPEDCACNGSLAWGVGPGDSEKFHVVAREEPFLASPLQYGVTPESDRKGYAARPLQAGQTYLLRAVRVGPCEDNSLDCQQMTAQGCQQFIW